MDKKIGVWVVPRVAYYFVLPVLLIESCFLYSGPDSFDPYTRGKMQFVIDITPIVLYFFFTWKVVIHSEGVDTIYGWIRKDNTYWGIVSSRVKWEDIKIDVDIDIMKRELLFKKGRKGKKIVIDLKKKNKYVDSILTLQLDENYPKWFYGEKYIENFGKLVALVYKYGKDTSMDYLVPECWNNTLGYFNEEVVIECDLPKPAELRAENNRRRMLNKKRRAQKQRKG